MNVYQRKQAVMADLGSIKPDATHPHHKFKYISYQHLMDTLRPLTIKHGLDVTAEVHEGGAIITLVNVEEPTDRIVQQFSPNGLPDDKAGSYVVKYGLMKLFLIGDGEDPDSGDLKPAATPKAQSTPSAGNGRAAADGALTGDRKVIADELARMSDEEKNKWLAGWDLVKVTPALLRGMDDTKAHELAESITAVPF